MPCFNVVVLWTRIITLFCVCNMGNDHIMSCCTHLKTCLFTSFVPLCILPPSEALTLHGDIATKRLFCALQSLVSQICWCLTVFYTVLYFMHAAHLVNWFILTKCCCNLMFRHTVLWKSHSEIHSVNLKAYGLMCKSQLYIRSQHIVWPYM